MKSNATDTSPLLMEKHEGSSVLGKHIHKCEHNVNLYIKINRVEKGLIN